MCKNYFTKKEVEALLKISQKTLESLMTRGKIEYFKINGRVRISEAQIDCYIKANTVEVIPPEKNQMAAN